MPDQRTALGQAPATERTASRWRRLWYVGLVGLAGVLVPALAPLRWLMLFFLAPLVADAVQWLRRPAGEETGTELPLPGPAERAGPLLFLARFRLSALLALLNPRQLAQMVRQIGGQQVAARRYAGEPPAPGTFRQQVAYRLPFQGEWFVFNGGVTPETSHSWDLIAQRYAYDFVIADPVGRRHDPDGTRLADYYCYDEPVLAPADGVVVEVCDGIRDAPQVGSGWVDWRCRDFRGNSVTIRHAEGEFSFLAHLVPGSIIVHEGQHVRSGDPIGRCGNSGHSTEPHLHFQLQDHPDFFQAAGLPVAFSECAVDGAPAGEAVHLHRGAFVQHAAGGRASEGG